jgi:hypothetical protein
MPADSEVQAVRQAVARLREVLQEALPKLTALDEARSGERPGSMRWSRKEILGHLVDSAGNNHQRFVRAQLDAATSFPPYAGDPFLAVQGYAERPWPEIVALWRALNQHLLHVAARIPIEKLDHVCTVSADEPSTLGHHVVDYVDHLEHHLGQILEGLE